ncbi:GNAT family N-acetyltransferase [Neobacillus sp. D3-1R]|uniref:GNAT family N-acetyltransferase n=1 Tax=Neobacillus sp. D3-1R TaxID=3445778 RepID=UPI003FA168B6
MNFDLKLCNKEEIKEMIHEYVSTLQSPFDSFLEEHILNSNFYSITTGEEAIGYYAIFKNQLLTQFFLKVSMYSSSQELFKQVLASHPISSIFVPTSDEFLLSTVLDQDFKLTKQAYFFQDSKVPVLQEKLYEGGQFRKAELSDAELIMEVSQDFFDRLEDRIEEGQIYVLMNENTLLGVGIVEKSILQEGYASVGMFVNDAFRKQGIGRTIIHHLKEWCYQNEITPICGCWYYNTNSKLTLESAGMVSKTRLLNFQVGNQD